MANYAYGVKPPDYYYPIVKTDEEMKTYAKNRAEGLYNAYLNNLQTSADYKKSLVEQAVKDLDPLYQQRITDLRESYQRKGDQLSDYALSRGMGRSSYAMDVQNRNLQELSRDEHTVQQEKMQQVNRYNQEILALSMDLENSKNELTAKMQREILDTIRELEKERDSTLWEAQKYNDDLWRNYQSMILKEKEYQLSQKKYELDVQKYQASLRAKSGGGSGRSSRKTSGGGLDTGSILKTWNGLSFNDKIKYLDENGKNIKAKNSSFYQQLKKEYDAIQKSKGMISGMLKDTFPMLF